MTRRSRRLLAELQSLLDQPIDPVDIEFEVAAYSLVAAATISAHQGVPAECAADDVARVRALCDRDGKQAEAAVVAKAREVTGERSSERELGPRLAALDVLVADLHATLHGRRHAAH